MNNEIKINVPEGMEIDKEHSTFECIKFKPKWVPKRGDVAVAGSPNSLQIILVGEYIKNCNITGFEVKSLAVLDISNYHLTIMNGDLLLWADKEASASEKELFIEKLNEQGYVYDPNDPRVIYKKEKELPKTWTEFCKNNKVKDGEVFIDECSGIIETESGYRDSIIDANLFPSEEYAKAMLALCKLIQLRDCYNGDWKPDWREASFKYVIKFYDECIYKDCSLRYRNLLAFKTAELRDTFCNNFEYLIKEAKLLL